MITITGASGNTGSKIANLLLDNGAQVRVIGRSEDHLRSLKDRGAEIMVGDQSDKEFLIKAFSGSDGAYLIIPPKLDAEDVRAYYNQLGDIAVEAIKRSGLKKLVFLSSLGAEQDFGTGPVLGLHDVEKKLEELSDVDIVILRPGYFMENTLWNIQLIKNEHINGGSASPDAQYYMIATKDIAAKASEFLVDPSFTGHSVVDLFGQKLSYNDVTHIIGAKIGEPDLPYVQFPDEDAIKGLKDMGLSDSLAKSFVDLSHAIGEGKVTVTHGNPEEPTSPTSYRQFVEEVFFPAFVG